MGQLLIDDQTKKVDATYRASHLEVGEVFSGKLDGFTGVWLRICDRAVLLKDPMIIVHVYDNDDTITDFVRLNATITITNV